MQYFELFFDTPFRRSRKLRPKDGSADPSQRRRRCEAPDVRLPSCLDFASIAQPPPQDLKRLRVRSRLNRRRSKRAITVLVFKSASNHNLICSLQFYRYTHCGVIFASFPLSPQALLRPRITVPKFGELAQVTQLCSQLAEPRKKERAPFVL